VSLDLYVGEKHVQNWGYGMFGVFRRGLAKHEGIDLDTMEGYGEPHTTWRGVRSPLRPLLNHPDDHGRLTIRQMAAMVGPLEQAVRETWPEELSFPRDYFHRGTELVKIMREAVEAGLPVEFSG
jgi:hypothetical protein